MALAIYGKHPAKGDFLEAGLAGLKPSLEVWLDAVLAETRHGLGERWETVWAAAPSLRFWLGEAIWGEPVAGVLIASADKVGRRFPLLILASGEDCPPAPVLEADQSWHASVEAHLRGVLALEAIAAPAALLDGLMPVVKDVLPAAPMPAGPADFWAVRPGGEVAGLWADVALTDHHRATRSRSYWWREGEDPGWSQLWAGEGLPSGHVLAWFFRGYQEND